MCRVISMHAEVEQSGRRNEVGNEGWSLIGHQTGRKEGGGEGGVVIDQVRNEGWLLIRLGMRGSR